MDIIKTRKTSKGTTYFLASNGKVITDISFIEYAQFEGLYTVTKKDGKFYTFLPTADGNKTYNELSAIIELGNVVYLIN